MSREGIQIGRIYGIPIFLHTSWFLIFGLIAFSFYSEFDALQLNIPASRLWGLGLMTSLLFFASLVFHEMAHSVIAKYYKIPVVSITLFVFGGVSRIGREPTRAMEEFNIAVAGPLSSFFLAGGFWLVGHEAGGNAILSTLSGSLATINFWLAIFNLVPGFPLDGGHIFRAIVWGFSKDYARSTRVAARSGQVIGLGMIALGAGAALRNYQPLGGAVGGLWLAFIGWFILSAAKQSQAQVEARGALEGLRVADIMTPELHTVGREISLEDYAREMVRTGRRAHLVVAGDQLVGLITAEALNAVPQQDWEVTSVQAVMLPKDKLHWAAPEEPALSLLDRMRTIGMQQMPVIAGGSVVGIVTRDSILRVLQSRHEVG
ncbi:MAG: site-2 protease family protein [Candidatus Acidiferrales bacterium]